MVTSLHNAQKGNCLKPTIFGEVLGRKVITLAEEALEETGMRVNQQKTVLKSIWDGAIMSQGILPGL